jgi:hypothetical protein
MSIMGLLCIWGVRLLLVRELLCLFLFLQCCTLGGHFYRRKYYISSGFIIIRIGTINREMDEANACRWWAVAIPSLATITLIYIFAALQGYNRAITPSLDRLECITGIPRTASLF